MNGEYDDHPNPILLHAFICLDKVETACILTLGSKGFHFLLDRSKRPRSRSARFLVSWWTTKCVWMF